MLNKWMDKKKNKIEKKIFGRIKQKEHVTTLGFRHGIENKEECIEDIKLGKVKNIFGNVANIEADPPKNPVDIKFALSFIPNGAANKLLVNLLQQGSISNNGDVWILFFSKVISLDHDIQFFIFSQTLYQRQLMYAMTVVARNLIQTIEPIEPIRFFNPIVLENLVNFIVKVQISNLKEKMVPNNERFFC